MASIRFLKQLSNAQLNLRVYEIINAWTFIPSVFAGGLPVSTVTKLLRNDLLSALFINSLGISKDSAIFKMALWASLQIIRNVCALGFLMRVNSWESN